MKKNKYISETDDPKLTAGQSATITCTLSGLV